RVKTTWFKKEGEQRDPTEVATVIASTLWRLCDRAIDNLSHADFDIITPQRGFRIIGELACFLVHYVDRLAFNRMDDEQRQEVVSAVGLRLAEIMEENILDFSDGEKDPEYDYQAGFIELINRRMGDYSEFDFPEDKASFPALRFLSLQIREVMEQSDQTWIQDQIMDIEMPEMMGTVKKSVEGFYPVQVGDKG
ncbi:MAG: hypothetical protein CO126_04385, partial [Hydrogenophilales bacterium CG_4_9_14_3_um_filter_63_34]